MRTQANHPFSLSKVVARKLENLSYRIAREAQGWQTPFSERRALLLIGDAFFIILSTWIAFVIWKYVASWGGRSFTATHISDRWYWFPIFLGGWWVLAHLTDLYHIPSSMDRLATGLRLIAVAILAFVVYLIIFFFTPRDWLPRLFFIYFLSLAMASIFIWRWIYAVLFKLLPIQYRVLILGRGERAYSLANSVLQQASVLKFHVLGYVDSCNDETIVAQNNLPVWHQIEDLPDLALQLRAQEIVVATEKEVSDEFFHQLIACQAKGIQVSLMPDLYEKLYHRIPIEHIDRHWALHAMQGQALFSRLQLTGKRLMDITLASLGLILLCPLLLAVAIAILLDSPGSVFYRQKRCGRAGRLFTIYKFRTMTINAEQDGQARWACKNDIRITRVGRFLRKARLDELPQLYNVLIGEMSIVGPRPERPEFFKMLEKEIPFYSTRLLVKPGLTGWAQINYDYGGTVRDALTKLQYDFYYIRYWSIWLDIYILFRTIAVIIKLKGT